MEAAIGGDAEAQPEPAAEARAPRLIDLVPDGDGPCILDDDTELPPSQRRRPLTHGGLRRFVDGAFATEAASCGLPRGARVCVALPSGPESATALFAFTAWGCYAPLSVAHTAAELSAELADLRPVALVVEGSATVWGCYAPLSEAAAAAAAAAAALGIQVLELTPDDETTGLFDLRASADPRAAVGCRHPAAGGGGGGDHSVAMLLQTSGTTKRPKTVALTHASLGCGVRRVADTLQLTPSDVCVNPMPLYHLHGIGVSLLASAISGAAVVCPRGAVDGRRLLRCLREHRATWYSATPTHHLALLQAAQAEQLNVDLPALAVPGVDGLRFIRNCSAALAAPLARSMRDAFRTTILPTYAMTESLPIASHPLAADAHGDVSKLGIAGEADDRLGSVGMPAGAEVAIMSVLEEGGGGAIDTAGVATGEVGEVAVRGPCLTPGYVSEVAGDPGSWTYSGLTESGWLRTGDLGYFDQAGYLYLTGRVKEIINRGGEVLSPFAIEAAMSAHPSVAACVGFAVPHSTLGETVGLLAVAAVGKDPVSLGALRTFALVEGSMGSRALPTVLVWAMPRALGLPAGRTGKPTRIGMAARLGLDRPDVQVDGNCSYSCCRSNNCWIGRRQETDGTAEGWQLEPWEEPQVGVSCVDVLTGAPTMEQVIAAAKAALRSCDIAAAPLTGGQQAAVVEAVRRLAIAAIGLDSSAASDIITSDGVLMDRGLDSMSATGFVDDLCIVLLPSSNSDESPWTTEILTRHATPSAIATALCELAAQPRAATSKRSDNLVHCENVLALAAGEEEQRTVDVVKVKPVVDEAQRQRAVAKSAARRAAKSAARPSKAERRAAFGGENTAAPVENASVAGSGLYHAKHGDLESLRALVEGKKRWDAAAVRDRHGLTALQWAAGGGYLDVVEYLLEEGRGGDVDVRSKDGRTALMWSCRNGALQVAERLVGAGANPKAVSKKGVSCLHWAVWGQQPELAGWLLSPPHSLELEGRSEAGCNAAVWAAASGGLGIAQWLHQQGADFNALNHWGHGVVNKAAWHNHLDLLRWMFATVPSTIEQLFLRDYAGFVPVELAAEAGHEGTACYLREVMTKHPHEFRPAITEDPVVHQHKLRELGLTDPNAM